MLVTRSQLIRLLSAEAREAEAYGDERRAFELFQRIDAVATGGAMTNVLSVCLLTLELQRQQPNQDRPGWAAAA